MAQNSAFGSAARKVERQQQTREQQQIIREHLAEADTAVGHVAFPDHDLGRIQIVLTDGEMGVDIPNALDAARTGNDLPWGVVRFEDFGNGAKIVEFER